MGFGPRSGRRAGGAFATGRPGSPAVMPPERRRSVLVRIVGFFRPYRLEVAVVVGAILVTSLLGIVIAATSLVVMPVGVMRSIGVSVRSTRVTLG